MILVDYKMIKYEILDLKKYVCYKITFILIQPRFPYKKFYKIKTNIIYQHKHL